MDQQAPSAGAVVAPAPANPAHNNSNNVADTNNINNNKVKNTNTNNNMEKKKRRKKKRPPHKSKMVTGYIIYASEIRKDVIKNYPDRDFGEISKLVGIEWKNLPTETKVAYEKRAQEQNAKSKAIAAEEKAKEEELMAAQQQQQQQPLPITNGNGHTITYSNNSDIYRINDGVINGTITPREGGVATVEMEVDLCNSGLARGQPIQISVNREVKNFECSYDPRHIVKQEQQQISTNVQYCNNNANSSNHCNDSSFSAPPIIVNHQHDPSTSSSPVRLIITPNTPGLQQNSNNNKMQQPRNTIVYRKPTTVRLKPKDSSTQTDPIRYIANEPKKPLRFSQEFIDHLSKSFNA